MDTNRGTATRAGPLRSLLFKELRQAVVLDAPEILEHAHVVFRAIPFIQMEQALAGELIAGKAKITAAPRPVSAGFDFAGDASFGFARIIAPATGAGLRVALERATEAAIHATGGNEHRLA